MRRTGVSVSVCGAGDIPTVRHADYLANWLAVLRADNRAIFKAASQASKAADFLLAFSQAPASPQEHTASLEEAA